ncbi:MAG: hypothetical protein JXR80_08930 [Deltaproteobacteria bacterium]|nr:hypothetical protein [Deltaproteobacteria bacterium]
MEEVMDSNLIALSVGSGQGLQQRMATPGLARSPGAQQTVEAGSVSKRSQGTPTGAVVDGDQLSPSLVGRAATLEWQQEVELAQNIGVADQVMGEIDDQLQKARQDLSEIVKMFPPYPHGSEERAEFLNSYRSLRLQIDDLVIPPEYDLSAQILGGELPSASLPAELNGLQVDSGSSGLGLMVPEVPVEDLADEDLAPVIADLERASGVLKERRLGLQAAAVALFDKAGGDEALYADLSLEAKGGLAAAADATIGRPETGIHNDLPNIYWGE